MKACVSRWRRTELPYMIMAGGAAGGVVKRPEGCLVAPCLWCRPDCRSFARVNLCFSSTPVSIILAREGRGSGVSAVGTVKSLGA